MKRNDIHKPSAIIPADYEFVGFDYYGPEAHVQTDQRIIHAHQRETGGDYSNHEHGGSCMVCGASAFYVGVFYHQKTNAYVAVGEQCAAKMEFSSGDWSAFRKDARASIEAHAGKQVAFKFLCGKGLQTAWFMWAADCEDLPVDESSPIKNYDTGEMLGFNILKDCITVRDIVGKLVRYGSISEKAEEFLGGLLKRIEDYPARMAARKAEREAAANCPTGRTTVTGVILKLEEREGQFGTVIKMTVKDATGFIVWTTLPSGLAEAKRGDTIKFTVTLTPSDRDPKFGFGKRPAVFVTDDEKAAAKAARKRQNERHALMQELGCFKYDSPNYGKTLEDIEVEKEQQ